MLHFLQCQLQYPPDQRCENGLEQEKRSISITTKEKWTTTGSGDKALLLSLAHDAVHKTVHPLRMEATMTSWSEIKMRSNIGMQEGTT